MHDLCHMVRAYFFMKFQATFKGKCEHEIKSLSVCLDFRYIVPGESHIHSVYHLRTEEATGETP